MTKPGKDWKLLEVRPIAPGGGRIVCVANQKGGVAKTTTAVNLAAALALRGHKTLIIDVDPQSNATTGVGIDHRTAEASSYDLLVGAAGLGDVVMPTALDDLFCVPSSLDLAGAEIELVGSLAREHKLAEALAGATDSYEIIFLDCPPSLGLITINALVAAQDLIVPVQCEYYALEGLGQLLNTAERVRRSLNPDLRIAGVLLTMYDARTKLSSQVSAEVRAHFGELVFKTVVPRSVRLSEAPSYGEPVVTLDPSSRGSISYKLLAAEVEARYGLASAGETKARVEPINEPVSEPVSEPVDEMAAERPATPGPGGRGYGTQTPQPDDLHLDWPRTEPWSEIAVDEPVATRRES